LTNLNPYGILESDKELQTMTRKEMAIRLASAIDRVSKLDKNYPVGFNGSGAMAIPFCCYGDYDSSCAVERANAIELRKEFHMVKRCFTNTSVVHYVELDRLSLDTMMRLEDLVLQLEKYPAIDDSAVSDYEYKAVMQAYEKYFKQEVPRGMKGKVRDILPLYIGEYAYMETGGNVWIDTEKLVANY
jgi:hypothetical protein